MIRNIFYFFMVFWTLISCSKNDKPNTIKYVNSQLTANASKTWRLKALAVNSQIQPLNSALSSYTKTYNSDGTWLDSDGYKGVFSILTVTSIKEVTNNSIAGSSTIQYDILTINGTSLIVEYTYNQVKYKFEFIS